MSSDGSTTEWSYIRDDKESLVENLETLSTSREVLARQGYIFNPLTEQQLQAKNRCQNCAKSLPKIKPCRVQPPFDDYDEFEEYRAHEKRTRELQKCIYHDEAQWSGKWRCCGRHMFAPGCQETDGHVPCDMADIRADWQFQRTPGPPTRPIFHRGSRTRTNVTARRSGVRTAVALDCEMGTSTIGTSPLIKLSVVDFMTGDTLINEFVVPTLEMLHYNTKYSGVTFKDMREARSSASSLLGAPQARSALFEYVDSDTFIIVHSGQNDLSALRLCHPPEKIIDTYTLEVNDRTLPEGAKKSLKEVCARRCGILIQNKRLPNGQPAGHDPLEDALATREIICSWLRGMEAESDTEVEEEESDEYDYESDDYQVDYDHRAYRL